MEKKVRIAGRLVGQGEPPYIIADIGANHNGDMELCKRLIDAAVECKVDAVKFQSWTEKSLVSKSIYNQNRNFLEEVKKYQLSPSEHLEIKKYSMSKGIGFCSTPFSMAEADMLEELEVPFFKIASMDVNNFSFLRHVARKKRPMVVSTGMATLGEVEQAVEVIRNEGNGQIVLLHCVSLYPPDFNIINLHNIQMLSDVFELPVGFSDHTLGFGCSIAAISLGASVIEKHFTLDKKMEGWDHAISADPPEMAVIVNEAKNIWRALGSYQRTVGEEEIEKAKFFRRSLVMKHSMKAGDVVAVQDVDFKRPGTGIKPDELPYVLGRRLVSDIEEDELLLWSHLV